MPPKRTRRASPPPSGLSAGERLKRTKLTGNAAYSAWGWVDAEVADASQIQDEHRLATCGFSRRSRRPLCPNKYSAKQESSAHVVTCKANGRSGPRPESSDVEMQDDVIVISDDEGPSCTSKVCKYNPYCLNYLGQDKWENAGERELRRLKQLTLTLGSGEAYEGYMRVYHLGDNPLINSRDGNMPIGLKVGPCVPCCDTSLANMLL